MTGAVRVRADIHRQHGHGRSFVPVGRLDRFDDLGLKCSTAVWAVGRPVHLIVNVGSHGARVLRSERATQQVVAVMSIQRLTSVKPETRSYFFTLILTFLVTALKVLSPAYFTVTVVVLVSFASLTVTLPFLTFLVTFLPL